MGFRLIPSFIAKVNRSDEDDFQDWYWQEGVLDLYFGFLFDSSYNAGQKAILEQNQIEIQNYLFEIGENYNDDEFLSYLQELLDNGKYEALSETWESFAKELLDLWDHSSGGDGFAKKKFLGVIYQ